MARTLTAIDMPMPRAKPSGRMLASPEPEEPKTQAEEGEPEVVAEPRLMSEALNYMAPRKGIDAPGDFRACSSCRNFINERAFHAATTGNRCLLFGDFQVEPHANCARYVPWPKGKPIEHVIEANALCCLNGSASSISPWAAGYCENREHNHQCRSCRHFDSGYQEDGSEPKPECEIFESLNRLAPNIFATPTAVDRNAGCSAWGEPVPDEDNPSGQEGSPRG